jgi:hypothetical protein
MIQRAATLCLLAALLTPTSGSATEVETISTQRVSLRSEDIKKERGCVTNYGVQRETYRLTLDKVERMLVETDHDRGLDMFATTLQDEGLVGKDVGLEDVRTQILRQNPLYQAYNPHRIYFEVKKPVSWIVCRT